MAQDSPTLKAIENAKKKRYEALKSRTELTVPLGRAWLRTVGETVQLRCWLGPEEPKVVGGRYGGWAIVERPRKKGITEWRGTEPLAIQVTLRIDRWVEGQETGSGLETEKEIRALERMAGLDKPGDEEPPLIRWNANGPHDYDEAPDVLWFVESVEWGVAMRNSVGNRVRQDATIVLREYVDDDFIQTGADKNKVKDAAKKRQEAIARRKARLRQKNHVIQKGEDLFEIAIKYRGKRNEYKTLMKLNPSIKDPRKLKVGSRIKLR